MRTKKLVFVGLFSTFILLFVSVIFIATMLIFEFFPKTASDFYMQRFIVSMKASIEKDYKKNKSKFTHIYETLAHERLTREAAVYPVKQYHFDAVDDFISTVYAKIDVYEFDNSIKLLDKNCRNCEVEKIMDISKMAFKNMFGECYKEQALLAKSIDEKKFDCDSGTTIHLSIPEVMKLDLKAIHISNKPGHVLIKGVTKDKNEFAVRPWYFETTSNVLYLDKDYLMRYKNSGGTVFEVLKEDFNRKIAMREIYSQFLTDMYYKNVTY